MKVTVTHGIQVAYGGETYRDGAAAEVPDAVGQRWVRNGWASHDGRAQVDPRGLGKADTAPDAWSVGEGRFEEPPPSSAPDEVDLKSGPGPAKQRAQRRARRDLRKGKASNDDE